MLTFLTNYVIFEMVFMPKYFRRFIFMGKEDNNLIAPNSSILPQTRKGYFEQGYDKLGRPYEKKLDDTGLYTKQEILKDGTKKLTIKQK